MKATKSVTTHDTACTNGHALTVTTYRRASGDALYVLHLLPAVQRISRIGVEIISRIGVQVSAISDGAHIS
jgi:hypothetical protein